MYKCRNRYHDGCGDKYISISSSNVHKYLHVLGERYQVLQHAYVYNLKKIVYLVGDNHSAIIQGIVVEFEPSLLYDYGRVLFSLKEIVFNWIPVYNNESEEDGNDTNNISISTLYATKIPDQVIEVAVEAGSNIPDSETLYSAFKLWLAMFSNTSILPLPSLKRVIPQYHAKWNATKSGSDTTTKLMDNLSIRQPHVNLETAAVCRLLHLGFVFIHRINAIFTANGDLNYPTITHFRNAASHRSTYYETIVKV